MSDEDRFSGEMGREYDLLTRAYPRYDELHGVLAGSVASHRSPRPGEALQALEIGCGSGITTRYLLDSRADLHLTSIDNEPRMIAQARRNLDGPAREGRLTIVQADALFHLQSTPEDSLDVVASGFTLHNFLVRYRSEVLAHVYRVLRPGGLFVNADKYSLQGQEMFDELVLQLGRFFDAFVPLGKIELLREWVLHNVADQAPDRAMAEVQALAEMARLGFVRAAPLYRHGLEAVVRGEKPVGST